MIMIPLVKKAIIILMDLRGSVWVDSDEEAV
jgi:hypothetical protein